MKPRVLFPIYAAATISGMEELSEPYIQGHLYRPRGARVKPELTKAQKKRRAAAKLARKARKKNQRK